MNPGDEVEIDVRRNQEVRTVRGELESREEALVLNNRRQIGQYGQEDLYRQRGQESWQTSYEDGRFYSQSQDRFQRGDLNSRLNSIEQQVNRLSRELENLRFALRDIRQNSQGQFGRTAERQAGYSDDYQQGRQYPSGQPQGARTSSRWEDQQRSGQVESGRTIDGGQFERQGQGSIDNRRGGQSDRFDESPGGEIGEERLRPETNEGSNR
jgi:hypothetical protein